jgi:hypothetical protein
MEDWFMATIEVGRTASADAAAKVRPNGAAWAAFLAAGIGAFAVGFFVVLSETDVWAPPTLYEPSGGVSGRTTAAVVAWLIAWAILHASWKGKEVRSGWVAPVTALLVGLGILGTVPPVWGWF